MSPLSGFPLAPFTHLVEASYLATSTWEAYAAGERQASTTTRALRVRRHLTPQGQCLTIEADPPVFRSSTDPPPLVALAQALAGLYARLELLLTSTGEVGALLNYGELRQAGERLLAELHAAAAPHDQITATLLTFTRRQLASPVAVLHSLQFDYFYQTLLAASNFSLLSAKQSTRQFAGFFDKTSLWFTEQSALESVAENALQQLRLLGSVDTNRTDVAAVRAHQVKALQLAIPRRALPELPAPHFHYEAVYSLEPTTSLPQAAELTVYARAGQLLNKEYHLILERI